MLPDWVVPFEDWTVRGRWRRGTRRPTATPAVARVDHHSVTRVGPNTSAIDAVRAVEEVIYGRRFTSFFSMVAYSFLLRDGVIFEGRGLDWRNGANNDTKRTGFTNANTLSLCYVGNFHPPAQGYDRLTEADIDASGRLHAWLIDEGHMVDVAPILPHRNMHATACCGDTAVSQLPAVRDAASRWLASSGLPLPQPTPSPIPEEDPVHVHHDTTTDETWLCQGNRARVMSDGVKSTGVAYAERLGLEVYPDANARFIVPDLYDIAK